MAENDLKMRSIDICSDIEDFFESYKLEDLSNEDEIIQYITEIEIEIETLKEMTFKTSIPTMRCNSMSWMIISRPLM